MRVPNLLTRPHASWLLVFHFKTCDLNPNLDLYPFRWIITNFGPNPTRSRPNLVHILRDPMRSHHYLVKSRPNLAGSFQISTPVIKLETDWNQPKTDKTRTKKYDQISGLVSGQIFIHSPQLGWVRVGHKPNLARPVDSPSLEASLQHLGPSTFSRDFSW